MTGTQSPAPAIASTTLQFRLLGRVEALRDGVALDLGARKQRAVLALLLLNANRVLSSERLIEELWGDSPPETARAALQVYIAGLRKALGTDGGRLRTSAPGYVLDVERGVLDLDRFAELRAKARASTGDEHKAALLHDALGLWRDTPLSELSSEPFAPAAIAQLEELRLGALEERIDADLALGRHRALVTELDALVAAYPYRERLRAQLMLALYRSGRQADALYAYQAGRRALSDELGLRPSQELRDLESAILRQDVALSAAVNGSRAADEAAGAVAPAVAHPRHRFGGARSGVWFGVVLAIGLAVIAAAIVALVLRGDSPSISAPPNSVAVIDPARNKVVNATPVGPRPGPMAEGGGSLWVGNVDDRTLTRIDPDSGQILKTITLPATPTGIAFGFDAVWVAHGRSGQLSRVDPQYNRVTKTLDLAGRSLYFPTGSVDVGAGWVWVVFGNSLLARVDPSAVRESGTTLAGVGAAAILVNSGSVWVANSGDANVQRFDPTTFEEGPVDEITVGRGPTAMAAGDDAIWVTSSGDDLVARVDPGAGSVATMISVGEKPEAVAVGAGAVWVANSGGATVSRIDPKKAKVAEEIPVGNAPHGIAFADGAVHVTVQAP